MKPISEIISSQRQFFNSNETKNISFRIDQLKRLKNVLQSNEERIYEAIYKDFKKSKFETYTTEIGILYKGINEAIKKVKQWAKPKSVRTNLPNFPSKSYIISEPFGVCLIIGAWNYPFLLSLEPAISAIAAGNTVILKPSEIAKNSSSIISELVNNNFYANFFVAIEGGVEETSAILEQKLDKVFFTGSTPVGKIVYSAAAKHLTPITLELGGKSPTFVFNDCNLKVAARRIVWGKFLNAGQTCIAPDYVMVEKSCKEIFLNELVTEIEKRKYAFENNNYVQIINEKNFKRIENFIDKNKIFYGGKTSIDERYISPTILTDINFEHNSMQEEIFGPILPILEFENLEDTLIKIKGREKPLACYIFTKSKRIRNKILSDISFGGGAINDTIMHISNPNLPFGGVGNSGIGNYHSIFGFNTFSHKKSILKKLNHIETNVKYSPYTNKKNKIIKFLLK